ncbi:yjeF N-terminal domain-containing protein 3 isoform X1 [Oryctolagus cuniculus]|uniref:yjeF N-terminal domain-containing protein 3 isoform X1 n=1 Tax=Oryctolagus cuniculus TaxID=9986 RepID=UPI00387A654A
MASLPPATGSAASSEHGGVEGEAGHAPAGGLRPHRLQAEPAASGTVGLQHVRGGHRDLALRVLGDDEVEPRAQASAHRGPGGPHRANAAAAGREGPQGAAAPAGEPGGGGRHYEGGARLEGGRVGVPHHALGVAHGRGAVRAAHRRGEAQRQPRLHVVHVAGASRAVSRRPRAINAAPRLRVSCGLGCARRRGPAGAGAPPTAWLTGGGAGQWSRAAPLRRSLIGGREGPPPWACCLKAVAAAAALTAAMSGAGGRAPAAAAAAAEERRFLSTAEAAALERELLEDYRFGRQQLVELCGHASAVAVAKVPDRRPPPERDQLQDPGGQEGLASQKPAGPPAASPHHGEENRGPGTAPRAAAVPPEDGAGSRHRAGCRERAESWEVPHTEPVPPPTRSLAATVYCFKNSIFMTQLLKYVFTYLKGRVREGLASAGSLPEWPRWPEQHPSGARSSIQVAHAGAGAQGALLSQATAESWMGSGAAGTRTGAHMGWQCHRQRLYPPWRGTSPPFFYLNVCVSKPAPGEERREQSRRSTPSAVSASVLGDSCPGSVLRALAPPDTALGSGLRQWQGGTVPRPWSRGLPPTPGSLCQPWGHTWPPDMGIPVGTVLTPTGYPGQEG